MRETRDEGASYAARSGLPATDLARPELRAWRAFLQAHAVVMRYLEAELAGEAGISLAHYDVLVQLAYADGRRLRMHELAERALLSRSGITRVVDRLVADGLVERRACPSDARGSYATLTTAGLGRLRDATPVHLAGVRRHFLAAISDVELATLASVLEGVVAACREPARAAADGAAPRADGMEPPADRVVSAGDAVRTAPAIGSRPPDDLASLAVAPDGGAFTTVASRRRPADAAGTPST